MPLPVVDQLRFDIARLTGIGRRLRVARRVRVVGRKCIDRGRDGVRHETRLVETVAPRIWRDRVGSAVIRFRDRDRERVVDDVRVRGRRVERSAARIARDRNVALRRGNRAEHAGRPRATRYTRDERERRERGSRAAREHDAISGARRTSGSGWPAIRSRRTTRAPWCH